jgi:cytochrome c biogenesis protein CcmG/thiol:disulfide interchange protein DsbE
VAPAFTVTDGSRTVNLANYRGRVVVLNFWATWCAPCIEELPSLTALQQRMPHIQVLAVSTDDDPAAYRRFLAQHPLSLLTVEDREQHANALYGTFRYPETYIIDPNGVIRRKFIGAQNWTSPEILAYLGQL